MTTGHCGLVVIGARGVRRVSHANPVRSPQCAAVRSCALVSLSSKLMRCHTELRHLRSGTIFCEALDGKELFKAVLPLCYHVAVIPLELLRCFSPVDSIASLYSCNPKSYYFPLMNRNSGIASQTLYEHSQPTINLLQSCDIGLMLRCPVTSRNAHSEIQTQFW